MFKNFKELKRNLKKSQDNYKVIKVSLLGDTATQFLSIALQGTAIDRGYKLDLFEAEYNQVERQVLDSTSELYAHQAQYTIIFQSTHKWLEHYAMADASRRNYFAKERLEFLRHACMSISGKIIYYNYPEIEDSIFGSYANKVDDSFIFQLRKFNYELMLLAQELPNLYICDIAGLQNKFGRDWMFDASMISIVRLATYGRASKDRIISVDTYTDASNIQSRPNLFCNPAISQRYRLGISCAKSINS